MKISVTDQSYSKTYSKKVKKINLNNISFFGLGQKFSDKKKLKFYKELRLLLNSGVRLKKALEIIRSQVKRKEDKILIEKINAEIVGGKTFSETMAATKQFTPYEFYSIQLGEETNNLQEILNELHEYFQRKIKIRRQIITVSTYPAFVVIVTIGVLTFMLNSVVPMFADVFRQFGNDLPPLTKKVIDVSNNFNLILSIVGIVVLGTFFVNFYFYNNNTYRNLKAKALLRVPFFGKLVNTMYLARFCQSMKLLLSAKNPLINSLDLTRKMINYYPIESSIEMIKKDIIFGRTLGESLSKFEVYDANLVSMIKVAEEVNELDVMFEKLSQQYIEDLEYKSKIIGVILEPLIIIIIGIIVGLIMVSMYMPMFDLSKILSS